MERSHPKKVERIPCDEKEDISRTYNERIAAVETEEMEKAGVLED